MLLPEALAAYTLLLAIALFKEVIKLTVKSIKEIACAAQTLPVVLLHVCEVSCCLPSTLILVSFKVPSGLAQSYGESMHQPNLHKFAVWHADKLQTRDADTTE